MGVEAARISVGSALGVPRAGKEQTGLSSRNSVSHMCAPHREFKPSW